MVINLYFNSDILVYKYGTKEETCNVTPRYYKEKNYNICVFIIFFK